MDDRIVLELECLARHGALDLELATAQPFRVRIECPARPVTSDELAAALDYRRPHEIALAVLAGHRVEIVLMVEDLDAAYERARTRGAVVAPLVRRPWGARDFRAADPFGFYLRFSEPHDVRVPPRDDRAGLSSGIL